ncbi:penicillin-binding protein 1C [Pseudoalteromonas rubra]|uniref:penicillin-binding protein 1C n=1 Tax=Pseudoalteromonas rubra TaxID=43658 RepID=UPI000A81C9D1|nr:penicillin-binding protein 1C [Pseudoalteromonas rubra]
MISAKPMRSPGYPGRIILAIGGLGLLLLSWLDWQYPLPQPYPDGPATVVTARDGQQLRAFSDKRGVHRYRISLEQVDPFYVTALLDYEDRWFYYHPGVNPLALCRALWQWLVHGRIISGGSTLTMQVARLLDPHERSVPGKLKQMARAIQLEWHYSKAEILTLYLNLAPFGGNIEGVEAASQRYFNKPARHLSINQSALLVVLPQKPSYNRPDRYPERARAMRNKVLRRLADSQLVNPEQLGLLSREPVSLSSDAQPPLAPLLSRRLKRQYPGQHVIRTTLDHTLQQRLSKLLTHTKHRLTGKSSAAVLIVHNQRAEVLAYQGSVDFRDDSRFAHVDMIRAVRSPGSTLKPFIYGLGLDLGLIHSQSLMSDIPSNFDGYKPQNLTGQFSGAVSASKALQHSLNVPAIQLLHRIGAERFEQQLSNAQIKLHHQHANLAVGLGGTGIELIELARLYRSLASQGKVRDLSLIAHHPRFPRSDYVLLSPGASWITFEMLSQLSAPDRVVPSNRRKIAWKTGTSYGYRDFWAVGVSADYTVAVWVGRPDASPIVGYLGATRAAPLMFDVFDLLPADVQSLALPAQVKPVQICWPGGLAHQNTPNSACQTQLSAYTLNGMTPPTMHSQGHFMTKPGWPDDLASWLERHNAPTQNTGNQRLRIIQPRSGQHYYRQQVSKIELTVSGGGDPQDKAVRWYINHEPHASTTLPLSDYQGNVVITACFAEHCDQQNIVIHP